MRLDDHGGAHLTYCSNIHPGETWAEVRANVEGVVGEVKRAVCPDAPFGVGLRLSAQAAATLAQGEAAQRFRRDLESRGLYVFTLNGFPYGRFHGAPVKADVYRPDWQEPERVAYTRDLITVLSALLRDGEEGSISTVPGCFKPRAGADAHQRIAENLAGLAAELWRQHQTGGAKIVLALEPEPCCLLETVAETVAFFEQHLFAGPGHRTFQRSTGLAGAAADDAIRTHLGVCLDTCHAAVEYEDPARAVRDLTGAGITLGKVQVTTGLRLSPPTDARLEGLRAFADDVYLHQVVARRGAQLERFVDLPDAFAAAADADEWRVHFHVPVFLEHLGTFDNTQPFVSAVLDVLAEDQPCRHLELETYTWDVLPDEYRDTPVVDAIARELRWVAQRWQR